MAISLIYIDSTGYWNSGITYYTKLNHGSFSLRGFDSEETTFGVYIRDRWDNMTDTLIEVLIPMKEKQLNRLNFKQVNLPGDVKDAWGWIMPNLWDGKITEPGYHTDIDGVWPQHFTLDLGTLKGAKLSRFKIWQRDMPPSGTTPYADRNIRKFEIWGSMNPNPSGAFDESWNLLLSDEIKKPFARMIDIAKVFGAHLNLVMINTPNSFKPTHIAEEIMDKFVSGLNLSNYTMNVYNDVNVEKGVLNFANKVNADIIALSTHGRTGFSHFFNGSISEDLVNHAVRPVITLKI